MEQKPWFIYALIDPRTSEIRYVGKTQYQTVEVRFKQHLKDSANGKQYRVYRWMRILHNYGLIPTVLVLESGAGAGVDEAEKRWISWYRPWGRLTNLTDGGEGSSKLFQSEEKRRKISESWKYRVVSDVTRKKMSELRKGKPLNHSAESRAKAAERCHELNKRPKSAETRKKIGDASRGRKRPPMPDSQRRKISAARLGKKLTVPRSAETRAKLSLSLKGRVIKPESIVKSLATRKLRGTTGKPHTEESKRKIKESLRRYWDQRLGFSTNTIPPADEITFVSDGAT